MNTFNPYLTFSGQCQQALTFYESAFKGKTIMRQTFGQSPQAVSGVNPTHIMYAEFKADNVFFMATDGINSDKVTSSNQITLNIGFDSAAEQARVFEALSKDGEIKMPLEKTFWGAMFGMVTDQFGISWMLNHQLINEQQ